MGIGARQKSGVSLKPSSQKKAEKFPGLRLYRSQLFFYHWQYNAALVVAAVVNDIVGDDTGGLVVIVASRVHVAIKPWEVGAAHLDTDAVSFFKVVGGTHGGQLDFIDLAIFHPNFLLISFSVAHPLDRFV